MSAPFEAGMKAAIDLVPSYIYFVDKNRRFQLANEPFAALLELKPEDIIGQHIEDIFIPEMCEVVIPALENALQGKHETVEKRFRSHDRDYNFYARYAPFYEENNKIMGVFCILTDISELKKAEKSMHHYKEQSHMLMQAVEASHAGITVADATIKEQPLIYVNKAFTNMTGYKWEETVGENCRFLQGRDTQDSAIANIRQAIVDQREITQDLINYRKNGEPFWNRLQISPVYDEIGTLINYIGVQEDITEVKKLWEREKQRQKLESLGILASGVAHEINNNLQPILLFSEILLAQCEHLTSQDRKYLQTITENTKKMRTIVADILSFSRDTEETRQSELCSLENLNTELIGLLQEITPKTIRLMSDFSEHLKGAMIEVDKTGFFQVLTNLIINAIHASNDKGEIRIYFAPYSKKLEKFKLTSVQQADFVCITVQDFGCGISEEFLPKIFDPFYSTKEAGQGTGLGLSIAHGLVKSWGGEIQVQSSCGVGTSISVFIPLSG